MRKVKHPPEMSRSGVNQYYHRCKAVKASRHYGVCLFTIQAFERKQPLQEVACVKAMAKGTCPAMKMHQKELEEGQALYFIPHTQKGAEKIKVKEPRRRHIDDQHPSYLRGQKIARKTNPQ